MRIQYFSDIHLEFGGFDAPATDADVVVAAGDIGVGTSGLEWLLSLDKPVVYVAGNHEYYGFEVGEVQRALRAGSADTQVHFLEEDEVILAGVRFIGCTLWTDFDAGDPELMRYAQECMNDYVQIGYGSRRLQPADTFNFNQRARAFLRSRLAERYAGPTVVVTHHAPLHQSWRGDPNPLIHAYCNQFDRQFPDWNDLPANLWVHGHIHYRKDYVHEGVRVVCNPRGYTGFQNVEGFHGGSLVELDEA